MVWPWCEFRMQVWKCCTRLAENAETQKIAKKSPSGHHRTNLSGYIFATEAHIDNRKKHVKHQYLLHMSPQYGELRPTSGWYCFGSLGHPSYFQRLSRLGSVTAWHCSSGRQPNFAALNRGCHVYSAGRPSRWALAHISSFYLFFHLCATDCVFSVNKYYQKRLTHRDAVWVLDSDGHKKSCVRWGSSAAEGRCHGNQFWYAICYNWLCGL